MALVLKTLLASLMIMGSSELAKRSTLAAAILISLPLTTILAMTFTYFETRDLPRVTQMSWEVFFMVIPSLILFPAFGLLSNKFQNFWISLLGSILITFVAYTLCMKLFQKVGWISG